MEKSISHVVVVESLMEFELKKKQADEKLVVIFFFANWCGPCKLIGPTFEKLATQFAGKAVMLKVDVEELEEIALQYGVLSMPTFIFLKNKRQYAFVGVNATKLCQTVEKFVGTEPIPLQTEDDEAEDYSPVLDAKRKQPIQSPCGQSKF